MNQHSKACLPATFLGRLFLLLIIFLLLVRIIPANRLIIIIPIFRLKVLIILGIIIVPFLVLQSLQIRLGDLPSSLSFRPVCKSVVFLPTFVIARLLFRFLFDGGSLPLPLPFVSSSFCLAESSEDRCNALIGSCPYITRHRQIHTGTRASRAFLPNSSSSWCFLSSRVLLPFWSPSFSPLVPDDGHSTKRPDACDLLARRCTSMGPVSKEQIRNGEAYLSLTAFFMNPKNIPCSDFLSRSR
jgi:hypothetical protein